MKVQAVQGSKVVGTATSQPNGTFVISDCQPAISPGAAGLELPRSVGRDRLARCNARDAVHHHRVIWDLDRVRRGDAGGGGWPPSHVTSSSCPVDGHGASGVRGGSPCPLLMRWFW